MDRGVRLENNENNSKARTFDDKQDQWKEDRGHKIRE